MRIAICWQVAMGPRLAADGGIGGRKTAFGLASGQRAPGWPNGGARGAAATIRTLLITAGLTLLSVTTAFAEQNRYWAATWATASKTITPFDAPLPVFDDTTLRQVVRISMGGDGFRVWLTNEFGTAPLNIGEAHLALRDMDSAIVPGSDRMLTFGGKASVAIAPGARVVSDPVNLAAPHLAELVISLHLPDDLSTSESPVTYHVRALQTNYLADGNQTAEDDLNAPTTVPSWFFIAAVDVRWYKPIPVIAALGDSITDGDQTQPEPVDQNARYTDFLAERLLVSNKMEWRGVDQASVVNLGISGNQVTSNFLGENAQARLNRDVLTQTGVTHVVVIEGINDIGLPVLLGAPSGATAEQLIAAHQQIAARARAAGLKTIAATLHPSGDSVLPGYGMGAVEEARQGLNEWIRTSGAYDMVADIDAALRDPDDPTRMRSDLSADGLHPNAEGYRVIAEQIHVALSQDRYKPPATWITITDEAVIGDGDLARPIRE